MDRPLQIGVLLSGGGTTLQNLLDRIDQGTLPARVVAVGSNKADAYGLTRAQQANIPAFAVDRKSCTTREEFSDKLFAPLRAAGADLVCLAGFLQLVRIPDDFAGRVLNIHPSLIPAFCGKGFHGRHVHEAVLASGVKVTGCTVHFADNEYDQGPIIVQQVVSVLDNDTPETLAARVFAAECSAYPEAIRLFAEGRLHIEGRRVKIR